MVLGERGCEGGVCVRVSCVFPLFLWDWRRELWSVDLCLYA